MKVVCQMDPSHFIEAAECLPVWKKIGKGPQFVREMDAALTRSKAWHEIKMSGANIFEEADTRLTASFHEMKGGLTNACFRLQTLKGNFFLRIPGKGSEEHLSREDEAHNVRIAQALGFNIEIHFFNPKSGLYVGEFLHNAIPLSPRLLSERQTMQDVARILRTLHSSPVLFKNTIPIFTRLVNLLDKIIDHKHTLLHDPDALHHRIKNLHRVCQQDTSPLVPCHNDPTYLNFLYQGRNLKLLDWEYSSNNKPLFDLANFALTSNLSNSSQQYLLQAYYGRSPTKQLWQVFSAYKQLTDLWYYLWAELQLANGSNLVPRQELKEMAHKHWHQAMGCAVNLPEPHALALDFV